MYLIMCKLNLESVCYDMRFCISPPSKKGNAMLFKNIVKTIKDSIKKKFSSKGKPTPKDGLVSPPSLRYIPSFSTQARFVCLLSTAGSFLLHSVSFVFGFDASVLSNALNY